MMPPDPLLELQARLGYSFKNRALLEQALTHSTFANENPAVGLSNERLEFLGDAVIGLLAAKLLYEMLHDQPEGELTRRRARVVRREGLASLAADLDLGTHLRLGQGQQRAGTGGGRLLANAFEALAGGVFLDGGYPGVEQAFEKRLRDAIDAARDARDFKTQLQEECHREGRKPPVYEVTSVSGPDHQRAYACRVLIDGEVMGEGTASSKKLAEQLCAERALERLSRKPAV
jgi:ribonuclease III